MNEMTREELESAIIHNNEKQTAKLLRWIVTMVAGGAISILVGGIAWGALKTTVSSANAKLIELDPKVTELQRWRAVTEATPRVHPQEIYGLDKRLQRVEDQNAVILEKLVKIDGKL